MAVWVRASAPSWRVEWRVVGLWGPARPGAGYDLEVDAVRASATTPATGDCLGLLVLVRDGARRFPGWMAVGGVLLRPDPAAPASERVPLAWSRGCDGLAAVLALTVGGARRVPPLAAVGPGDDGRLLLPAGDVVPMTEYLACARHAWDDAAVRGLSRVCQGVARVLLPDASRVRRLALALALFGRWCVGYQSDWTCDGNGVLRDDGDQWGVVLPETDRGSRWRCDCEELALIVVALHGAWVRLGLAPADTACVGLNAVARGMAPGNDHLTVAVFDTGPAREWALAESAGSLPAAPVCDAPVAGEQADVAAIHGRMAAAGVSPGPPTCCVPEVGGVTTAAPLTQLKRVLPGTPGWAHDGATPATWSTWARHMVPVPVRAPHLDHRRRRVWPLPPLPAPVSDVSTDHMLRDLAAFVANLRPGAVLVMSPVPPPARATSFSVSLARWSWCRVHLVEI